jgi:rhamnosyltransferase
MPPMLSVIIRNKNQANDLALCLATLYKQETTIPFEVVVVDNNSRDNSIDIIKKYNCTLVNISDAEFTYGRSLNKGIAAAKGSYILIMSAHIILLSKCFLQSLPTLFENEKIAGLRFTECSSGRLKNSISNPYTILHSVEKNLVIKAWENGTVNHCAAIRKSVWMQFPYQDELFYSEDKIWSIKVLQNGFSIITNIPLYYRYNKKFTRKEILEKRANEAAAYQLIANKSATFNTHYNKSSFNFLLIQLKSFYSNIHAHFWVKAKTKAIVKQQKHTFKHKFCE